jgi:dipeptidase D
MSFVLLKLQEKLGEHAFNLVSLEGGAARNAIMKNIKTTIAVDPFLADLLNDALQEIRADVLKESIHAEEQQMTLQATRSEQQGSLMLDDESTNRVIRLIDFLPDGLVKTSDEIPGFPETSTNIGIIKASDTGVNIQIMSRSPIPDQLEKIRKHIKDRAESFGARVELSPAYSGWPPVRDSEINKIVSAAWQEVAGKPMELRYTHGGLECGVLLGRFTHLQAISIGPTILGAHTTEEKVNIESVKRYYRLLKEIVKNVSTSSQ